MVDIADIKYKAVILLLASTGMRRDALVNIEWSKDMEYLKIYKIRIYKKSDSEQVCFTTPEPAWYRTMKHLHKKMGTNADNIGYYSGEDGEQQSKGRLMSASSSDSQTTIPAFLLCRNKVLRDL